MLQISAELLAMTSEAAVLVKNGRVAFANGEAQNLLGKECVGKGARKLLGEELSEIQASSFIGDFLFNGKRHIIRMRSSGDIKAFFFSPADIPQDLISDAFIFSLRSCLMNINLSLSVLQSSAKLHPDLVGGLAGISHESFKINRIISNICFLRSTLDNNLIFCPVQLDLSQHICDTIDSIRSIIPGTDICFRSSGPLVLHADPALVDCLLLNLISNALGHARGCSRISVSLIQSRNSAILSVDDDGCGIAPDKLHCVFDRYRHSFEMGELDAGAGLGLTVARLISSVHGGTLLLESRHGKGTAVRASFSVNPYADLPLKQLAPAYEKDMKTLLSGLAECLPTEYFVDKYLD